MWRTRWAALGAAVAVTVGAGGIGITHATTSSGERPIYLPIEPCRLADTRPAPDNVGPRNTPLGTDETYKLSGWGAVGNCNLPSDTAGLALNVTAVGPTLPTFLTLFPADVGLPLASHLNPTPGQPPTPNAVNVDLDAAGEFNIYNLQGNVDVIVDVVGIYDDHDHDDRYLGISQDSEAAIYGKDEAGDVGTTDVTVATVTVDTPTSGYVILNSSASLFGDDGTVRARCSITTGTTWDDSASQIHEVVNLDWATISGTRGYQINKAFVIDPDERTYNLVCNATAGSYSLRDPQLTAIFIPDPDAFGISIGI